MADIVPGAEYRSTSHGVSLLPVMDLSQSLSCFSTPSGLPLQPCKTVPFIHTRVQLSLSGEHVSQFPSYFTGRSLVS